MRRSKSDKLRPLPKDSFELSETKEAKVQIDSHVAFEGHSYSAPYQLQGESVLVRASGLTIEIFHRGKHPEHSYKRLGLLRVRQTLRSERLEAACERAFAAGARSYQSVKSILEQGAGSGFRSREQSPQRESIEHEHLRGPKYYN